MDQIAVGYTGPRTGMNAHQENRVRELLIELGATVLHHGDCRGGDEQAHAIARDLGLQVVSHPPTASGLRAYCIVDEEHQPLPYLARNHMIVRSTVFLIATPGGPEMLRSGTWATIRYVRKLHAPHEVITRAEQRPSRKRGVIWPGRPGPPETEPDQRVVTP